MSRRVNSSSVINGQSLADSLLDFMNASASERGNISSPIDDEQLNKYLSFESDDFRWKGTSDQLKRFFAEDLKLSGKWNSPSGGVWSFSTKEYEVKWQKSMKLVVIRDTTDKFMSNCLMKSLANDNLNRSYVRKSEHLGKDFPGGIPVDYEESFSNNAVNACAFTFVTLAHFLLSDTELTNILQHAMEDKIIKTAELVINDFPR